MRKILFERPSLPVRHMASRTCRRTGGPPAGRNEIPFFGIHVQRLFGFTRHVNRTPKPFALDDVILAVFVLLKVAPEVAVVDEDVRESRVLTSDDRRRVGFGRLFQMTLLILAKTDEGKEAAKEDRKSVGDEPRLFRGGEKGIVSTRPSFANPFDVHYRSTHGHRQSVFFTCVEDDKQTPYTLLAE